MILPDINNDGYVMIVMSNQREGIIYELHNGVYEMYHDKVVWPEKGGRLEAGYLKGMLAAVLLSSITTVSPNLAQAPTAPLQMRLPIKSSARVAPHLIPSMEPVHLIM
jgi:hypothetical protein